MINDHSDAATPDLDESLLYSLTYSLDNSQSVFWNASTDDEILVIATQPSSELPLSPLCDFSVITVTMVGERSGT